MPLNLLAPGAAPGTRTLPFLRGWAPAPDAGRSPAPRLDAVGVLRVLAVAALVVPGLLFALAAALAYRQSVEDATVLVEQAARTASEHASRLFDANRLLLQSVDVALGATPAAHWRAREQELHAVLQDTAEGLPHIRGVWYFDEQGRPVASSRNHPVTRAIDVSDRAYFRALRDGRHEGLYISEVFSSKETSSSVFVVAARRDAPDGGFAGVVMAGLSPAYFTGFYDELRRSTPGLTLGLVRQDGAQLAAVPVRTPGELQETAAPMLRAVAGGAEAGTFTSSAGDGQARIVSYRRVGAYPLYAVVGLDRSGVLAGWLRHVGLLAAFTFPLSFTLAGVAVLALRRTHLERVAQADKEQEAERRRRAESALQERRRLEALGQLTGAVAHDFNNLLAVISNNVHLLRRAAPDTAGKPQLAAIARSVDTGARLTRQLLSFSRRQALKPEVLLLQRQLPAMAEMLRTTVGRAVHLVLEIEPDTPAIRVDQSEFELAILNLAMNARDAMPEGGELHITAHGERDDEGQERVALAIRDTGHGIPPELLDRVCEPFFTTKPVGKGTGLGLSQVHGFATQSGGRMDIRSEPGRFTEIVLMLPASAPGTLPPGSAGAETIPPRLKGTVLLVEDNPEVAAAVHEVLRSAGCDVVQAGTGEAAIAVLAEGRAIDAVLSDVVMPGTVNGVQLALWVRQHRPGLPVLLTTGYSTEVPRAREAGVPVLQKPVMPSALLAELADALASRAHPAAA